MKLRPILLMTLLNIGFLSSQSITQKDALLNIQPINSQPINSQPSSLGAPLQEKNLPKRQKVFLIAGFSSYTGMATGLYFSWYAKHEQESFHLFNDWGEWRHMDKVGHSYSAYIQAQLISDLALWSGYDANKALLFGSLSSIAGQLTIEIMDGFSSGWGFSISDVGANLIGTSTYYFQQKHWGEQRLRFKMSYFPVTHAGPPILSQSGLSTSLLDTRAKDLYGHSGIERFLKDYNGQTIWLSANISAFIPDSRWPEWLGMALGYSIDGVYGGYANGWQEGTDTFVLDDHMYPRSSQIVLALDYDLSKLKTDSVFLKGILKVLNIFKWPAPAISYNTEGQWQAHLIFLN